MLTRRLPVSGPYDLALTMSPLRRGRSDPTQRRAEGGLWRVARTPDGVATACLSRVDGDVVCTAWGAGASWMLEQAPALVGLCDDPSGFAPIEPLLHDLHRRNLGLRLPRTGLVLEQLVPAILEQKVTGLEAHRSWNELVRRFGEPAPGPAPAGMMVAPATDSWTYRPGSGTWPVWICRVSERSGRPRRWRGGWSSALGCRRSTPPGGCGCCPVSVCGPPRR